jgi:hypothetical protein
MRRAADTPARRAWRVAFGQWRRVRRDLLADGAIDTASEAAAIMRTLSGAWDLPSPASRYVGLQEASSRLPPQILSNGRTMPRRVWCGPYRAGRLFLRRT